VTPNAPARHDRTVEDKVIAPGGRWSGIVKRGQVLRLIDLEGRQAIDFLCYNAADPSERYNAVWPTQLLLSQRVQACPQINNPANAYNPTPTQVVIRDVD
jgi:uncharacterized protein YcgI (DUF1989 family)